MARVRVSSLVVEGPEVTNSWTVSKLVLTEVSRSLRRRTVFQAATSCNAKLITNGSRILSTSPDLLKILRDDAQLTHCLLTNEEPIC